MTRFTELLAAKRDGLVHSEGDLRFLADAVGSGDVPDYQAAAWLMAAFINGLGPSETTALTLAIRDSGSVLQWGDGPPTADKHSTGGVGDKISLILAPLAAACGIRVPMISGRSLGHTGGTLDKLESIPGMNVNLSLERFAQLVESRGVAMCGQTDQLAPADRKLYALRDATATVTSIPLITASILSKKLAENTDALVFDVKVGTGAFMKDMESASKLARSLTGIARNCGVRATALLTSMDVPLGRMAGNALEVRESIEVLEGGGPEDVRELSVILTAAMLAAAMPKEYPDRIQAESYCRNILDEGLGLSRFQSMVELQGGDLDAFRRLPPAPSRLELKASGSGLFGGMNALEVGETVRALGGGRYSLDQEIDPAVGWEQLAEPGSEVRSGQLLGIVHAGTEEDALSALDRLSRAVFWNRTPEPLLRKVI